MVFTKLCRSLRSSSVGSATHPLLYSQNSICLCSRSRRSSSAICHKPSSVFTKLCKVSTEGLAEALRESARCNKPSNNLTKLWYLSEALRQCATKTHPLHKALRPLVEALQSATCNKPSISLTKLYGVSLKLLKVRYRTKSSTVFIELHFTTQSRQPGPKRGFLGSSSWKSATCNKTLFLKSFEETWLQRSISVVQDCLGWRVHGFGFQAA